MKRTIVIGDIHGCYDDMLALLNQIGITDEDMVVSLGDIVDRGNKSKAVYEFFKNRTNAKVLIGNHERKHINQVLSYAQQIVKLQFGEDYPSFLTWLHTLDYYYETDEALIVHAAFEQGKTIEEQKQEVLSGATAGERYLEKIYPPNTYWTDYYKGDKPIIYGHHVVGDTPKIHNNTFGIDTGACHGGYLTAIELPNFKIHQVKVQTDYWKEEQITGQIPVLKAKNWQDMNFDAIQKQLDRLDYIDNSEVKAYLKRIKNGLIEHDELLNQIMLKLNELAIKLQKQYGKEFNKEASQYPFKTFLFKSNAGTLTQKDVGKVLDTPTKRCELARHLGIDNVPLSI
jgi:serine/threonine protein phosphatase 1